MLGVLALRSRLRGGFPCKRKVELAQNSAAQHIALGHWEAASQELRLLVRRKLGGVRSQVLYAQVLRGIQRPMEALEVVEEALQSHPNHLDLIHQKGKVLLDLGASQEALSYLFQCVPIIHGEEDHLDLASAFFQEGYIKEAWDQISPFIVQSRNGRLYALAGDCHFRWKQYCRALFYYLKGQYCGWKTHTMVMRIGFCLLHCNKLNEAERYFHRILVHDSSDVLSTLGLGAVLEAKRQYQQALAVYQGGNAWDHCHGIILRQAGLCAIRMKQHQFAEMYLKAAIRHGERSPKSFAFLAYCLECQHKWVDAEKVYFQLIEEHPDHVAGYRGIARLFGVGLSNHIDERTGLAMAHQAVKISPDAISWELLSACEARIGNFIKAHDIQEQLSSYPSDEHSRQRRHRAMRTLRQKTPLDEHLVCQALVA